MKYELPHGHGLDDRILYDPTLLPQTEGVPSITDVQYEALAAGVAHGQSVLAVAPTSTGKTNIAMWGLLSWMNNPRIGDGNKEVWKKALKGFSAHKLDDAEKSSLNTLLHFDDNISSLIVCPGDIWEIINKDSFFKLVETPSKSGACAAQVEKETCKELSITGVRMVCMEISPSCDFSNKKKTLKSLVLGSLVPYELLSKAQKEKISKREESLKSILVDIEGNQFILSLSQKYILSISHDKLKDLERNRHNRGVVVRKITRMRESLLLSWIQSIASHNSRIGTVSFH